MADRKFAKNHPRCSAPAIPGAGCFTPLPYAPRLFDSVRFVSVIPQPFLPLQLRCALKAVLHSK